MKEREPTRLTKKGVHYFAVLAGFIALLVTVVGRAQQSTLTSDQQAALQAIEATTPLPATSTPETGIFYTVQQGDNWPPLPGNTMNLPFWDLGNGVYLLDDRSVDYAALQAEADEAVTMSAGSNSRFSMMTSSSLNSSYAYANPVYLTNMAATLGSTSTVASFSIAGGTNFVPYDIVTTTDLTNSLAQSQWTWLGIGYTSNTYTFSNQPLDQSFYALARPQQTMVVGWGDDSGGQCDVPFGLSNALMVAGGYAHSLALLNDGSVKAWGYGPSGEASVPTNIAGVTMIASGWYHNVVLFTNGTVTAWGLSGNAFSPPWHLTDVPSNLTAVTVISAQALHSLALTSNGTVVAWGYGPLGEASVPSDLSNVVAIAAGFQFNLAVKTDGTVRAWGYNGFGQTNVPAGLSNVVDVAAGVYHSLALLNNGTVVAWGDNSAGETNVPVGLTNVVAIAAGGDPTAIDSAYSLALKSDGTVVPWGEGLPVGAVQGMSNVFAIGAGANHALAIRSGPRTPVITLEPTDQYQVAGGNATFTARGSGFYSVTYQWQFNGTNIVGATNATLTLTNMQSAQQGNYQVVVSDANGSITNASIAAFTLVTPPVITSLTQPAQQLPFYQSNLTLSVVAAAPGQSNGFPLGYQWQYNGTTEQISLARS